MKRGQPSTPTLAHRVVYQAASWCLSYPDHELVGRAALMRSPLADGARLGQHPFGQGAVGAQRLQVLEVQIGHE